MGSSAKKKSSKRADFQKPKLKVGKTRPKPSNFTDTSFKAKSITLTPQSLTTSAPTSNQQFTHHLSLLSSHSASQRRDSLAYLTNLISTLPAKSPLPQPPSILLPKLSPLLLDGSAGVRGQLLTLLRAISNRQGTGGQKEDTADADGAPSNDTDITPQVEKTLLYVRAGLTHIAPGVRESAADALGWLLDVTGDEVVGCAGGWAKTLKAICVTLTWRVDVPEPESESGPERVTTGAGRGGGGEGRGTWSQPSLAVTMATSTTSSGGGGATTAPQKPVLLNVLATFLRWGLLPRSQSHNNTQSSTPSSLLSLSFPHDLITPHLLPQKSNAYGHLNLFGPQRDAEGASYEDLEDRRRVFRDLGFRAAVERGLEGLRKEGGEVGRAAARVKKVLREEEEEEMGED